MNSNPDSLVYSAITISSAVIIIIVNSVEIHILRKRTSKRSYERFLWSLSCADLLLGLFRLANNVSLFLLPLSTQRQNRPIILSVYLYFLSVSVCHLLVISIDRLHAVAFPIHHKVHECVRITRYKIILSWIPANTAVPGFIAYYFVKKLNGDEFRAIMGAVMVYIAVIDSIAYFLIYTLVAYFIYRKKRIGSQNEQLRQQIKVQRRGLILCVCTVLAFITFYLPYAVIGIIMKDIDKIPRWVFEMAMFGPAMNSIVFLAQEFLKKFHGN